MTPDAAALAKLTPEQRGLVAALELHAKHDPKTWRAKVDAIACETERAVADAYLRVIVVRIRASRDAANAAAGRINSHAAPRAPAPGRPDRVGIPKPPAGRR
jgi:hypothetical protein